MRLPASGGGMSHGDVFSAVCCHVLHAGSLHKESIVDTTTMLKETEFDPLLKAVGKVVQEKRLLLGISQEELARRAKLHRTYISDVERGSRSVSLITLVKLAEALATSASVLVETAEHSAGR